MPNDCIVFDVGTGSLPCLAQCTFAGSNIEFAPKTVSYLIVIDSELDWITSYFPPHPTGAPAQEESNKIIRR